MILQQAIAKLEGKEITRSMSKLKKHKTPDQLFSDVKRLIEESRQYVAQTVNTTLSLLYWKIGKRIGSDLLQNKRAEYGKQIVASLARQLTDRFGNGWDVKTLRHCLRSAETFSEELILSTTQRQLGYLTELPSKKLLQQKLHQAIEISKKQMDNL